MKRLLIALTAAVTVMTACQKEPSFEDPNSNPGSGGGGTGGGSGGGGSTPQGLLVRSVQATSTDSTVTQYGYDASKRLTSLAINSSQYNVSVRIVRNSSGIINQIVLKSDALTTYGIDSVVSRVNYNSATSRYTSTVYNLSIQGFSFTDSTALSYDGSGNLTSKMTFERVAPFSYDTISKVDYTYASGNVTTEKGYEYDDSLGKFVQVTTTSYTYDSKASPLILGVEALLFYDGTLFGSNNATVVDYVDLTDPTQNYKVTYSYSYNSSSKPSGGTAVETPGSVNYTLRYYYN